MHFIIFFQVPDVVLVDPVRELSPFLGMGMCYPWYSFNDAAVHHCSSMRDAQEYRYLFDTSSCFLGICNTVTSACIPFVYARGKREAFLFEGRGGAESSSMTRQRQTKFASWIRGSHICAPFLGWPNISVLLSERRWHNLYPRGWGTSGRVTAGGPRQGCSALGGPACRINLLHGSSEGLLVKGFLATQPYLPCLRFFIFLSFIH